MNMIWNLADFLLSTVQIIAKKGKWNYFMSGSSWHYFTFKPFVLASAETRNNASDVISLSNAVTRREKKAAVAGTLKCQSLCSND